MQNTSNEPLFLTKGREHIAMIVRQTRIAHPVKHAQPGISPKTPGIGVKSHSVCMN